LESSSPPPERSGSPPVNLVVMGRITGAFGIKGWVKLQVFTASPESLTAYTQWWIEDAAGWQQCRVEEAQAQTGTVVAKLAGCEDRNAAAAYGGRGVAIPRDAFPAAGPNEFYWADLVGLKVVNAEAEDLGTVSRVFETGANDVLVIEGDRERLIPFTQEVVKQVDLEAGVIRVEWGADY
jgi:16S rRNA processing protein RimM